MNTKLEVNIQRHRLFFAAIVVGFSSLVYEVSATKMLFYFFSENTYSTSAVLGIFLLGLAIGSFIFSKIESRINNKMLFFSSINWAVALYAIIIFTRFDVIPLFLNYFYDYYGDSFRVLLIAKLVISTLYLIVPTIFLGLMVPFLLSEGADSNKKNISLIYGYDLCGAIVGTLLSGFVLIPMLGLKTTILIGAAANIVISFIFISRSHVLKLLLLSSIILISIMFYVLKPWQTDLNVMFEKLPDRDTLSKMILPKTDAPESTQAYFKKQNFLKTIFFEHSPFGEVRVLEQSQDIALKGNYDNGDRLLYIESRLECGTYKWNENDVSEIHFVETALKLFDKGPLNTVNIGLGCGLTLATIVKNPKTEKVDAIEINPVVVKASRYFDTWTNNVLDNPKVNLMIQDGFGYFINNDKKYDLVAMDIENPSVIQSGPLYTYEFFKYVRQSLKENGVFAVWGYRKRTDMSYAIIYKTLKKAFPYVYFKTSGIFENLYFFASQEPMDISRLGLTPLELGLIHEVDTMEDVEVNTLDRPVLSYKWLTKRKYKN